MDVEKRILVGDFLHGQRRIVDVSQARVGILVRQQLRGVFLLQFDHAAVEYAGALERVFPASLHFRRVAHAVGFHELAIIQQIEIDVDAALLQLRDEIVVAVQRFGIEMARIAFAVIEQPRAARIGIVQAQKIDAVFGKPLGEHFGIGLFGRGERAADVRAEKARPLPIREIEMPILAHREKSMFAGRRVEQAAEIDFGQRRIVEREGPFVPAPGIRAFHARFLLPGGELRRRAEPERQADTDSQSQSDVAHTSASDSRAR
ncbi:MAG: hypothetical protein BWZ10_01247 [candidate division BRC1 bacterium ADurb.BinA364]|nr:MAG: hypothetical protein BWZ10_01247 [candidate division BRC1 bacterium ADurb.BinA364]